MLFAICSRGTKAFVNLFPFWTHALLLSASIKPFDRFDGFDKYLNGAADMKHTVSREVYINDKYTWLSHEQLTAALTFYLADMRRVDSAIRAGGDLGVVHGMDDIPEHNSLMYEVIL